MIDENWYIVGGGDNANGNVHRMLQLVFIFFLGTITYDLLSM
jgi:hypothetical protein